MHIAYNSNFSGLRDPGGFRGLRGQFELILKIRNLDSLGINVHINSNGHFCDLLGHGGLHTALVVASDLGFKLSDLNQSINMSCNSDDSANKLHIDKIPRVYELNISP